MIPLGRENCWFWRWFFTSKDFMGSSIFAPLSVIRIQIPDCLFSKLVYFSKSLKTDFDKTKQNRLAHLSKTPWLQAGLSRRLNSPVQPSWEARPLERNPSWARWSRLYFIFSENFSWSQEYRRITNSQSNLFWSLSRLPLSM